MAKVLLGWEMGTGLGHLRALVPMLKGLQRHGHQPVLAVRTLSSVALFKDLNVDVFQAPYLVPKKKQATGSLADILDGLGWSDLNVVKMMTMAWQSIIEAVKPALIISDYSPGLNLAAFKRVPTVVIGTGFTVPPNRNPLPPIRPWMKDLPPQTLKKQRNIEEVIARVCEELGISLPGHLAELFHPFRSYVLSLELLDPYARHRDEPQLPELKNEAVGPRVAINKKKKMFFAYLDGAFSSTPNILKALASLKHPCEAYVRDFSPQMRQKYSSPSLRLHAGPQALDYIFNDFRAMVHHGGSMCQDVAAAGLAQLLFPKQAEQTISARLLADLGVAVGIPTAKARQYEMVKKGLEIFLSKPRWLRATELSDRIRSQYKGRAMDKILEDCLQVLGGEGG
ncbi:MAG: hypothetical protein PVG03_01825 [Desulfarculaceae bacterium]|jgi:UDP:flavonoid glycosyltransferase YjiC (YdhE family)